MQTMAHVTDGVTQLVPGGDRNLARLSDADLLANTRSLVGESNHVFAALLAHLAEVETRGLHRTRACASLYTYCIYELRFSEDAAARRAGAAKLVKRFPVLLEAIAHGELHLTGLLMLGPHLTPENVLTILARAKFRTKKELAKLVRELHPLPLVPDSIEPLGVEPRPARQPSWAQFVAALAPSVRSLPSGDRPCDWGLGATPHSPAPARVDALPLAPSEDPRPALACVDAPPEAEPEDRPPAPARVEAPPEPQGAAFIRAPEQIGPPLEPQTPAVPPAPARVDAAPASRAQPPAPQQYQVQFSTTEEHVQLIERAKALLARDATSKSLGELHLRAMKLLVQALEKEKFATLGGPRPRRAHAAAQSAVPAAQSAAPAAQSAVPAAQPAVPAAQSAAPAAQSAVPAAQPAFVAEHVSGIQREPERRNRHVPAATRRLVFERDGGRCTFVDERGERCRETHRLELHHQHPFAKRGPHSPANLTLHCPAHNALAAERDFGGQHMTHRRGQFRRESLATQEREAARYADL